ncbi:hypothetical protein DFR26_1571 [Paraperlucidibaca baekdonensis]|uniref:TRAP-type C4-dicarboxylate transport system substrate-binding protein n=1 Tax=Paraperlucidibaca baekdonensis TaxID=748120 RepID=A0A3E0H3A8_9GAMM|nr:putative solute-binding protein [Paraperlucidibaca baekdonensis]REH37788.1 hypothetical protein DFR26_1571 [Paraperlucidibaca baekdonensis]
MGSNTLQDEIRQVGRWLAACALMACSASLAAAPAKLAPLSPPVVLKVCLFDPSGANGPLAQTGKDLAVDALAFGLKLDLKTYQDERVASDDFKAGRCDVVGMSTLRARQYNRIVGSIDSPGNVRSYAQMKTLIRALAHPDFMPMSITGRYQVIGVLPIGALYVMTRDKRINSIEKAAGKRVAVLDWDPSQAKMISAIGAQPVASDITTFAGKFNNGQVDIIAAPAMAFYPLELYRGIGTEGGIIRFPLLQATGTILMRRDLVLPKIPDLDARMLQLRDYGLRFIDTFVERLKKADANLPENLWINLSEEEKARYSRMLREARLKMTADGVYDTSMMHLLRKVRCKHEPDNEECSLFDE